jgi:hypothetical protein
MFTSGMKETSQS